MRQDSKTKVIPCLAVLLHRFANRSLSKRVVDHNESHAKGGASDVNDCVPYVVRVFNGGVLKVVCCLC